MSDGCDKCGEHSLDCACKEHEEYYDHLKIMEKTYLFKDDKEMKFESPDFMDGMSKLDRLRANLIRKQQYSLLRHRLVP